MLTYIACLLSCMIVSAIPTGRVEVVYPTIETFRDGMKSVTFHAFGQDINLRLQPAGQVISKDFSVLDGDGNEIIDSEFDVERLRRNLYTDKMMGSSLYIDEDGPLHIYGVVNSKLRIEPQDVVENNKRAHLVIEIKEDKNARFKDKVIPAGIKKNAYQRDEQTYDCLLIEYVFITESTFTESFPRSNNVTLEEYLCVLIEGVQLRMDSFGLGIKVTLIGRIELRRKSEAKKAPYIKKSVIPGHSECLDANKLLDGMANYYTGTKISKIRKADIVMLIVGQNLCNVENEEFSQLAGLAYTGGVCDEEYKFGLSQDDISQFEREDTVAHESCHLLGCPHDGDGPVDSIFNSPGSEDCNMSGYIMDTSQGVKTHPLEFSPCCIENVEHMLTLIQSACLKVECPDDDYYYYYYY